MIQRERCDRRLAKPSCSQRSSIFMGVYTRNGIVFTAGTTDWAQVLEQDRNVVAITRDVVDRLRAG